MKMEAFIHGIPKAELHIHIEGSLEPELMFELAAKNGIRLPFESVADIRRAYDFPLSASELTILRSISNRRLSSPKRYIQLSSPVLRT